jgi:diguanylate cyclase (GGDEF)-like protein
VKRPASISIHGWIFIASLLSAVPLLLFCGGITYRLLDNQEQREEQALRQRADAAAVAVRRRLDRASAAMEALATSDAAMLEDMGSLYRQARRLIAAHPDAVAIGLVTQNGDQIFSTLADFNAPLPASSAVGSESLVFSEGRVLYSNVFRGSLTGRLVMAVAVPVRMNGIVKYSLRITLPADAFTAVLNDQQWPADWTGVVVDANGVLAARTRDAEKYVGSVVVDALHEAIASGARRFFDSVTKDGIPVKTYVTSVPGTEWHVVVGVPSAAFSRDLEINLRLLLLAGAGCLFLGVIGSWLIAKEVGWQVALLTQASSGAIDPAHARLAKSSIREVAAITGALSEGRGRERDLKKRLKTARHDPLTKLPRRDLFDEYVNEAIKSRNIDDVGAAILYIDLDGFKGVNDRLGHDTGDEVLRQVGDAIRHVVRDRDIAGRLGGDEFAIFIVGSHEALQDTTTTVAERLLTKVGEIGHGVGCSIGIATSHASEFVLDTVIAVADTAMRNVKSSGKNGFALAETYSTKLP